MILILGGGFGGVSVLRRLQDNFQTDVSVDLILISKENYLLFTPMLHEVASGILQYAFSSDPNNTSFFFVCCLVLQFVVLYNL